MEDKKYSIFDFEKMEWVTKITDDWTKYPCFADPKKPVKEEVKEEIEPEEEVNVLTVQDLLDKINLCLNRGWIDKKDLVFIALSDEKEDYYPIQNISGNKITFYDIFTTDEGGSEFREWVERKSARIAFVFPKELKFEDKK